MILAAFNAAMMLVSDIFSGSGSSSSWSLSGVRGSSSGVKSSGLSVKAGATARLSSKEVNSSKDIFVGILREDCSASQLVIST